MAIAVTALGTNSDKSGVSPWTTFSGVTLATGDDLLVAVAYDPYVIVITWNGNTMTQESSVSNPGDVACTLRRYKVASGGTGDVVVTRAFGGDAIAVALYKVTGLDASPLDKVSSGIGSGADANTGTTTILSQADELVIAVTGVEDEIDDAHGTWTAGAGYVSGNEQFDATNGGGDASNVQCHAVAEVVSATTAQTGLDAGHDDKIDWAACIATYKGAAVWPTKVTQYLPGNDLPEFPHEMDLMSDKLPCPPPYD